MPLTDANQRRRDAARENWKLARAAIAHREKVIGLLFNGYGIEDIAVILGQPADKIRDTIRHLRRSGQLLAVYA